MNFAEELSGEKLKGIPGVLQVENLGRNCFRIRFSDVYEVMEQVVEQSAVNDWHLSEMRLEKSSLDHVFAELSKKKR